MISVDSWAPHLTPMVLVGSRKPRAATERGSDLGHSLITRVSCQTGGLACAHHTVVGYILRLADASSTALRDPSPLLQAFSQINSAGGWLVERPGIDLRPFAGTRGEKYGAHELSSLSEHLGTFFNLPPLASGEEGILSFAQVPLLSYFAGWPILEVVPRSQQAVGVAYTEGSIAKEFSVLPGSGLTAAHIDRLSVALGGAPVRAFLVWTNSD